MENSIALTYSEFERNVRQEFQSSSVSIKSRPKRRNTEDLDTTAASTGTNYSTFARNIRPIGIFTSSALQQSIESNVEGSENISDFDISSISIGTTYSEFKENMKPGTDFISTNLRGEEDSTFEDETIISNESSVSTYSEFARKIRNSSDVLQSTELSIKSRRNLKRQKTSDDFDTSASSAGTTYSSFARNVRPTGIFTSSKVDASHESNESNSDLNLSSISTSTTYSDFQRNMRQGQDFRSSSLKGGEESFVMSSDDEEDQKTLTSTDGAMDISLISTASTTYSGFERNMGPLGILTSSGINERQPFASTPTKGSKLVQLTFEDEEISSEEDGKSDDDANDPDWKMSDATILSELSSTLSSSTPFKHPRQNAKAAPQASKSKAECQSVTENQIEKRSSTTDQSKRKIQPKSFSCSECKKQFTSKPNLKLHEKIHAKIRERFPCETCKRPFSRKNNSVHHKYTHMNSEELKQTNIYNKTCETCQHVFFAKRNYEDHLNSHNGVKTYPCSKCSKSFTQKSHADKHILLVHATAEERKEIEESWKYSCEICKKRFRIACNLEEHKLSHSEAKPLKCSTCEKDFKYKKGLKKHKLIHANQKKFKCGQCEKAFTEKGNLVKHVNGVHLKLKPFICQLCNAAFSQKPHLKRHLKCVHKEFS